MGISISAAAVIALLLLDWLLDDVTEGENTHPKVNEEPSAVEESMALE